MGEKMVQIWGIHMDRKLELRPISEGYVCIGWKQVGSLDKISEQTRETYKLAVALAYPDAKPGAVPVWAGTLFKFRNAMDTGHLVVFPSKIDRKINIGKVTGFYSHRPDVEPEYPNFRKVDWLKQLPRSNFSQGFLNEVGSAVTLFSVSRHAEEVDRALTGLPPRPDAASDQESVADAVSGITATAEDFILRRLKTELTPEQFEHFVADLLGAMGFHARVTEFSGDGGVDVIAHKDELGFEPPIIKVQVKQTEDTIGDPIVSQLYGKVNHGESGLFVTLGGYSKQALNVERSKSNLRLIAGSELANLFQKHYRRLPMRYQILIPLTQIYVPDVLPEAEPPTEEVD